jgi:prepilin-type N-terminal cleavage/methylation domain-containing protein
MPNIHHSKKGFTLIELMIAITILAVLASVGLTVYSKSQVIARDSRRKQDLQAIRTALELYYQKNGDYPPATAWVNSTSGGNWIPGLDSTFINQMPLDPSNSPTNCNSTGSFPIGCFSYGYYYDPNYCGATTSHLYILSVRLENSADKNSGQIITFTASPSCTWGSPGLYTLSSQ